MSPDSKRRIRPRFHRPIVALSAALLVCASCAAPRRQPLDDARIASNVMSRASSAAELEVALALADLGPLAVPKPTAASLDPASPEFWHACAYLFEPEVRQARRRVEAKRALARGAGAIPSIGGSIDRVGSGSDRETMAWATIDLLALLGLGPAAAAKELAGAEVCEAMANLESAVWSARVRVDRARVRLAADIRRRGIAEAIGQEAMEDSPRVEELGRAGRVPPAEVAWARAAIERIRGIAAQARVDAAEAREEIATASGLPPEHPALADDGSAPFPDDGNDSPPVRSSDPRTLLARSPKLRALRFQYAVAEARVRTAAAATWPQIEVGPKLKAVPDNYIPGGVLDLTIPLPAATQATICAALAERTAAREALEDALVRVRARLEALNERVERTAGPVLRSNEARRDAAAAMWRAARTQFGTSEGPLATWAFALEMHTDAALAVVDTRETLMLLALDGEEESGPAPAFPESRPQ